MAFNEKKKMIFFNSFIVYIRPMQFLLFLGSLFGIAFFGGEAEIKKRPLYFAPPKIIKYFTLGYDDFTANMLWLRYLQSADFCSFEKGIPVYRGDKKTCELGWAYRMVDAITELAPRFKPVYTISTSIMSVFTGDIKGAENILLKGVQQFPKDWRINFHTAYLYALEIKDPVKAARYAYTAAENGGPSWLYGLSAKQHGASGNRKLGEAVLQGLLERKDLDEGQRKQVEEQLRRLREESE